MSANRKERVKKFLSEKIKNDVVPFRMFGHHYTGPFTALDLKIFRLWEYAHEVNGYPIPEDAIPSEMPTNLIDLASFTHDALYWNASPRFIKIADAFHKQATKSLSSSSKGFSSVVSEFYFNGWRKALKDGEISKSEFEALIEANELSKKMVEYMNHKGYFFDIDDGGIVKKQKGETRYAEDVYTELIIMYINLKNRLIKDYLNTLTPEEREKQKSYGDTDLIIDSLKESGSPLFNEEEAINIEKEKPAINIETSAPSPSEEQEKSEMSFNEKPLRGMPEVLKIKDEKERLKILGGAPKEEGEYGIKGKKILVVDLVDLLKEINLKLHKIKGFDASKAGVSLKTSKMSKMRLVENIELIRHIAEKAEEKGETFKDYVESRTIQAILENYNNTTNNNIEQDNVFMKQVGGQKKPLLSEEKATDILLTEIKIKEAEKEAEEAKSEFIEEPKKFGTKEAKTILKPSAGIAPDAKEEARKLEEKNLRILAQKRKVQELTEQRERQQKELERLRKIEEAQKFGRRRQKEIEEEQITIEQINEAQAEALERIQKEQAQQREAQSAVFDMVKLQPPPASETKTETKIQLKPPAPLGMEEVLPNPASVMPSEAQIQHDIQASAVFEYEPDQKGSASTNAVKAYRYIADEIRYTNAGIDVRVYAEAGPTPPTASYVSIHNRPGKSSFVWPSIMEKVEREKKIIEARKSLKEVNLNNYQPRFHTLGQPINKIYALPETLDISKKTQPLYAGIYN